MGGARRVPGIVKNSDRNSEEEHGIVPGIVKNSGRSKKSAKNSKE